MATRGSNILGSLLLVTLALSATLPSCSEGEIADGNCPLLACPAEGIAQGNANVSGFARADSFFVAAVQLDRTSAEIERDLRGELDDIAALLDLRPGASADELVAALRARLDAHLEGTLSISNSPARCTTDAAVFMDTAWLCDSKVPLDEAPDCQGACEALVTIVGRARCRTDAEVTCAGIAPRFACDGTCEGLCELPTGGACSGNCRGTCEGTCRGAVGENNRCEGSCDGSCTGTCELLVDAVCAGQCRGICRIKPPDARCSPEFPALCESTSDAAGFLDDVGCSGKCLGKLELPTAARHCEAAAIARSSIAASCLRPRLALSYELKQSVTGDGAARRAFEVWLSGFKIRYGALLAQLAKAELLVESAQALTSAAPSAVDAFSLDSEQSMTGGDIAYGFGLLRALEQIPETVDLVEKSSRSLASQVNAATKLTSVVAAR